MVEPGIQSALESLQQGKMIVLVDSDESDNVGILMMAAQMATPDAVNFMAKNGKGIVCLAMAPDLIDRLDLPPMVEENKSTLGDAFTVSIEAKQGVTTGISAADRAHTIQTAIAPDTKPEDISIPGHIFPLKAKPGGVLERTGRTEAAVDLARLAGLRSAAVTCGILNADGEMAKLPELESFADQHDLQVVKVTDLVAYRMNTSSLVKKEAGAKLPTPFGEFDAVVFSNELDDREHIALVMGDVTAHESVPVRVHSECLTGDAFGSFRCDCGEQLESAMKIVADEGVGVILYLRQEGRGIGLTAKIKAYALQEKGYDTIQANEKLGFKADQREYGIGAQILAALGVSKMRLMTNNPVKLVALDGYGLQIVDRIPLTIEPREENKDYMTTKSERMGHMLKL